MLNPQLAQGNYMANARANNKGWRIDYHILTNNLVSRLKSARVLPDAKYSDHCPVVVELED